nr:hypothetical protein CFP56_24872 [Quercus suber]
MGLTFVHPSHSHFLSCHPFHPLTWVFIQSHLRCSRSHPPTVRLLPLLQPSTPHIQAEQAVRLPAMAEGRPKRISKPPPYGTGGHKHGHKVGPEASDEKHARPSRYTRQPKVQKSVSGEAVANAEKELSLMVETQDSISQRMFWVRENKYQASEMHPILEMALKYVRQSWQGNGVSRWHPEDASRPDLENAPIFYPTEALDGLFLSVSFPSVVAHGSDRFSDRANPVASVGVVSGTKRAADSVP